jgi:Fe-S oxidoreductase
VSLAGQLLLVGLGAFALAGVARSRRWFRGGPARVDILAGLLAVPGRYLVDVHDAVARDRFAAWMHVPTAAGFVLVVLLGFLVLVLGLETIALRYALAIAAGVLGVGALVVAWRRRHRPGRLSRGGFVRLPGALVACAGVFGLSALGLPDGPGLAQVLIAIAGAWGVTEAIGLGPFGPMRHALAGALHLAFHPRPARFGAERPDVALAPLDLALPKLGVETPRDFPWNRLLGFDACVQCGRCEEACPAFAAGQPLNPKKLIQDLVLGTERVEATDKGYSGSPHPGRPIGQARGGIDRPVIGELVHPDTLWSCTTCRACVHECPMMIEHVDAVIELRRFQTLERGAVPSKAAAMLEELRATDNQGGRDPATRLDWAADLRLPVLAEGGATDVLLWLGEAAFDLRGQRTLRALVGLLRRAGVEFAVLGAAELDCGDLARRLGDEATFQDLARRTIEALATRRFARIVTADPHALNALRNDYPALGGTYSVVHHTALLAELVAAGRLAVARPLAETITYHDPCYLGRYNGEVEAPRRLLGALASDVREMERHGLRSLCCGGGGGAPLADVPGKRRIPDLRMDQARATGAATVAVACPNCALMLEGVVGPRPRVADVAELLAEAVAA